ncbi:unnamed protein product [Schistocephalus solidus]|uniref:RNA-binding protein NOB1 n=1 Tax=Schistocephalus solidus TaxID=70667 RepID=A0A183TDY5_SCHSO|nr:unnamed protein product [Schistocephalus solidus]
MAVNTGPRAIHLVVDSVAFIERADLKTYGTTIHTVPSVIAELRDKRTREYVAALPFPISVEVPQPESVKWGKKNLSLISREVSKRTGDFFVLSKPDLDVIALSYELFKQETGTEPVLKEVRKFKLNGQNSCTPMPPEARFTSETTVCDSEGDDDRGQCGSSNCQSESDKDFDAISGDSSDSFKDVEEAPGGTDWEKALEAHTVADEVEEDEWITADNFDKKLETGLGLENLREFIFSAAYDASVLLNRIIDLSFVCISPQTVRCFSPVRDDEIDPADASPVAVACLTKDFAIQNVLMHAGITLLALSGKIIKRPRTHVLWCGSCYAYTTKQGTYFCPLCGCPNLRRIPVTLHENGELEFHFARKFNKNLRGTKFPIHRPKGGKHADEPIYRADQRLPDRRPPKKKNPLVIPTAATNGLLDGDDEDASVLFNPAEVSHAFLGGEKDLINVMFPTHDVTSKAATQGLRSDGQIVPHCWETHNGFHGLKPTKYLANRPGRRRTGGKKHKLTK